MRKKRLRRTEVLSDTEDSSDDDDFHQSHPRKRPIPRSPSQDNTRGFNSGSTPSIPDLTSPPSDHIPDSTTCSDDDIIVDDGDSDSGESSTYNNDLPSDCEESSTTEERTQLCNISGYILEDIISPTSIYVTHFQVTKEELVERLYHLYNTTVFENKLPEKMDIVWNKRLTKASGQCRHIEQNNQRFSVIELSDKVCDSAERLRSVLVHEMCHAACWIIDGEDRDNHGPLWQAYTRRVNDIHPELPEVTMYHSYTINYNYKYQCSLCDNKFGRFRQIALNKCYCRHCGCRLLQLSTS
ncbi:germ cell nuclear acidic protein-like [Ranitomeya variabilis]|uniref:germ cell nuclear acidic protein-like n=3 Tax=Ranitomeya variabilis TaxID=490064 RepID=UPI0040576393